MVFHQLLDLRYLLLYRATCLHCSGGTNLGRSWSPWILESSTQGGSRSHRHWPDQLRDYLREMDSSRPRIVIATMDTAATGRFLDRAAVGKHTLIVVDEVHKIGAPSRRKVLDLDPGGRLGLSATPERFGDTEGTDAIGDFFGDILKPGFSIADAQRSTPRRLVPYTYHFGIVALRQAEAAEYRRLTKQIGALAKQVGK